VWPPPELAGAAYAPQSAALNSAARSSNRWLKTTKICGCRLVFADPLDHRVLTETRTSLISPQVKFPDVS